jgi:hypothetical protein
MESSECIHIPKKGMLEIASEQTLHTDGHSIERSKPSDEPSGRVRVFARTGFFVLYSVFKERHSRDGAYTELDLLAGHAPAN